MNAIIGEARKVCKLPGTHLSDWNIYRLPVIWLEVLESRFHSRQANFPVTYTPLSRPTCDIASKENFIRVRIKNGCLMGKSESRIERNLVESWVVTNDVEKCRVEDLEERRVS